MNGRRRGDTRPSGDGPHDGEVGNHLHIVAAVEEQSSVGRNGIAGTPVRSRLKRGEPHGRQQGATNLHGRGGASRRGGEKPRGRNEVDAWQRRPEGEPVVTPRSRELTPRARTTEGIFGKPQERNSDARHIGTLGPQSVGKEARKVKRVDSIGFYSFPIVPGRRSSKVPPGAARAACQEKATDGGGKPTCRDFGQVFPPRT